MNRQARLIKLRRIERRVHKNGWPVAVGTSASAVANALKRQQHYKAAQNAGLWLPIEDWRKSGGK